MNREPRGGTVTATQARQIRRGVARSQAPAILMGMGGLGDNIYQRPLAWALLGSGRKLYIRTPWPELYSDMDVAGFIALNTELRTQSKNVARQNPGRWLERLPHFADSIRITYGGASLEHGATIIQAMEQAAKIEAQPFRFDLPPFVAPDIPVGGKPIAVVRPVSIRAEWPNHARNPWPGYVTVAAGILRERGYSVVAVADLENGKEWLLKGLPPADHYFLHGELSVPDLMGLIRAASVVVGGIGWIVPACLAAAAPAMVIAGGHGAYNNPETVMDPRMGDRGMRFIVPDRFCRCRDMRHECDKRIRNFAPRFLEALESVERGRHAH